MRNIYVYLLPVNEKYKDHSKLTDRDFIVNGKKYTLKEFSTILNFSNLKPHDFWFKFIKENVDSQLAEMIIPVHYIGYLFNADPSGLSEEEIEQIDNATKGFYAVDYKDDRDFKFTNDINNLGSECITVIFRNYV